MSEQTNTTNLAAKAAPLPIKLDVNVRPIEPKDNLLAYAKVTINDSFVVHGIKLCSGKNGPYLNMPGYTTKNNTWRDTCNPITSDFRTQLTEAVVVGYDRARDKMRNTLANSDKAITERASVVDNLKANQEKVAAMPPREAPAKVAEAR